MKRSWEDEEAMTKPAGYYDVRQALSEPGCPLCRLLERDADRYVETVLYEMVMDVEARLAFNRSQGYCREHTWLMARRGASLGVAILMRDLLEGVLRTLAEEPVAPPPAFSLRQLWRSINPPQPEPAGGESTGPLPCAVCDHLQTNEAYYLSALLRYLSGPDNLVEAYLASGGLCAPHFRLALSRATSGQVRESLVSIQKSVWQQLRAELSEFIRKNDYRFAKEEVGDEGDAWLRAIEALVGAPPTRPPRDS